jgi:hypothetical protein
MAVVGLLILRLDLQVSWAMAAMEFDQLAEVPEVPEEEGLVLLVRLVAEERRPRLVQAGSVKARTW